MATLHVFNPEHDLALAVGNGSYTAPSQIVKIKEKLSLLPALYADNGDFIFIATENQYVREQLQYYNVVIEKGLKLITPNQIHTIDNEIDFIQPWGWDHAVVNLLKESGVDASLLPSVHELENLRTLSHRRVTIPFRKFLCHYLNQTDDKLPEELFALTVVETFLEKNPVSFFKAPWSSSGRGIVVSDHISHRGLMEWAHGVIKKQGSVIGEKAWQKKLDFATEWIISNHEPRFIGFSVFNTSSRGKYHGNINVSQDKMYRLIKNAAPCFSYEYIFAQYSALKKFIAPIYNGPVGIDMLSDINGEINPCVEINLRMTMGMIPLLSSQILKSL